GVDAGELAEVGELPELGRGEPQAGDPGIEAVARLPVAHGEWQKGLRGDQVADLLRLVLEVGPAVRTLFGHHAVLEQDDRPATGASHLAGMAGDFGPGPVLVAGEELFQVVFPDAGLFLVVRLRDHFGVSAIRAPESAGGRVEVQLGPALPAWEFSPRGRVLGLGGAQGRGAGGVPGPGPGARAG